MSSATPGLAPDVAAESVLRLGDTCLVLAQRLSAWCGHGPALEEDIALANIALDLLGQARGLLTRAGELEGVGRDEDRLAYLRDAPDFRNLLLAEQPHGDFAHTIVRHLLWDCFAVELWPALARSSDEVLAGVAGKAAKESAYHLRHTSGWLVRLGDGTEESRRRVLDALDALWPYAGEAMLDDDVDRQAAEAGLVPLPSSIEPAWRKRVADVLVEATLPVPPDVWWQRGGKQGQHSEHLSYLLGEMQVLHRSDPDAQW
ncbi:MAG: 1,2-phenylacetyl-CoA epoxidase subunit PaaC [Mycobacteriales bacterium]|nr:1,2-phenylacetyl-CoA epoxidase subunit PaaC [Mycobacteriales bacterium]